MRLAFLWDWTPEYSQTITWQDGLAAAIKELMGRGHDVAVLVPGDEFNIVKHPYFNITVTNDIVGLVKELKPDAILHWGDMTRPHAKPLSELGIPMAICFAGGEANNYNTPLFDHIFVESQVYKDKLNDAGFDNVSIAFGTNTDLFKPIEQVKTFDTIFPATFALWKRHSLYANATHGLRSLAVGYIYTDHEQECWEDCLKHDVTILPHVSAEALKYLYAASRICVIPSMSSGGSQRTVLEAMAMNIPVIVTDSDKFDFAEGKVYKVAPDASELKMFVNALLDGETETDTRDYILNNWSHIQYADALEEGLKKII